MLLGGLLASAPAQADQSQLRFSKGFGLNYLPMYLVEHDKLVEKHAKEMGLGAITTDWRILDGGNVINDAMLAGALDIASIGTSGYLTLWSKAKGNAKLEVIGLGGVGIGSLYLNTRNPNIKSLKDFTEKDKIAVPGIKTSLAALLLQMSVAHELGDDNYAKLDPLTVGMPYPEALAVMLSGKTEVNSHFASAPFNLLELDDPAIHRVVNTADFLGPVTAIMAYTTKSFAEKNPKLTAAFVAALDEACKSIAKDKPAAARVYIEMSKVRMGEAEVMRVLNDPDTSYDIAPKGVMKYASFMSRVGIIKNKPADWKEVFVAAIHDRNGD